jgi:galactose oxidase-like protein
MKSLSLIPLANRTSIAVASVALCFSLFPDRGHAACLQLAWLDVISGQSPSGRFGHAMAYDSFRGVTILFGGLDTNNLILGDTWQYDNHGWKQLHPAHAPSVRFRHTLSYDAQRGVIVLFGGRDNGSNFNDLWEWNGSDWTAVSVSGNVPVPRHWHGMAFDSLRGVHILFGGYSAGTDEYGDTYEYDGNARTWTLRATTGPSPRHGVALAYDIARNRTVLFGGYTFAGATLPDHYLADTWLWDGQSGIWVSQNPVTVPQGRTMYSFAYDTVRSVLLMQNGEIAFDATTTATVRESWEWNGTDWLQLYDFCCPRREAALVYELAHQRMIMFGGDGFRPDGTWSLAPVWTEQDAVQVDWNPQVPNVYPTVRQGLAAARNCVFVDVRVGDYNETGNGISPLVISKPSQFSTYRLFGDVATAVRIH